MLALLPHIRPTEKQAVAAVGQVALTHLYQNLFSGYNKIIAQFLLTKADFSDRNRYVNARNVSLNLLKKGIIPVVNENDADIDCKKQEFELHP